MSILPSKTADVFVVNVSGPIEDGIHAQYVASQLDGRQPTSVALVACIPGVDRDRLVNASGTDALVPFMPAGYAKSTTTAIAKAAIVA